MNSKVFCLFLLSNFVSCCTSGPVITSASSSRQSSVQQQPSDDEKGMIGQKLLDDNNDGKDDDSNIEIIFSDVDGTLVHYPENIEDHVGTDENKIIRLPPSATGMQGIISTETMRKCAALRERPQYREGPKLVLVSGMRSTTLWKRIPYLPRADAYCSEAGGRIFYPIKKSGGSTKTSTSPSSMLFRLEPYSGATESDLEPFELEEDEEWRSFMKLKVGEEGYSGNELDAGSSGRNTVTTTSIVIPLEKRSGLLWQFGIELQNKGYVLDTKGYSTCFRVNRNQQTLVSKEDFDALYSIVVPDGLATSVNLGCIDFYPEESGKKNCCEYVAKKLCRKEIRLENNAVCICDDDNDLEMAMACKHAFVPGISSESMLDVVKNNPNKITATGGVDNLEEGTTATERALNAVQELIRHN